MYLGDIWRRKGGGGGGIDRSFYVLIEGKAWTGRGEGKGAGGGEIGKVSVWETEGWKKKKVSLSGYKEEKTKTGREIRKI